MSISVSLSLWKAHVRTAVTEFNSLYPSTSIGTYPGHDPDQSLAVDLMIPSYKTAAGNAFGWTVARWIWANRVRLGVWYVIFDGKIISQTRPAAGWARYFDAGNANDSKSHKNHVHVSFYAATPPGWKPSVGEVWIDLLVPGVTDSASIRLVQKALGIPQTGTLDAATIEATKEFQRSLGDDVDGFLGKLQATALFQKAGMSVTVRTDPSGQAPKPPVVTPPPVVKPPVVIPPTSTPKPPTPKPEVPAVSHIETIFGLNILRRTDEVAGRKRWPTRKPLIGKVLRDAKATVYLLIETDEQTRKDCAAELGDNFAYWGFKYYGVFWDQRVWERVGGATNEFEFRDNNNRFLLSLPLRHKASGKVIAFDVTHLENDGDTATDGHKARKVEMTHLVEKASKGDRAGFADINSTTPGVIAKPTARQTEKPRFILVRAGARLVSSLGAKVKNLAYGSHHGGKSGVKGPLIDEGWTFGDVEIVDAEIVRTDGTDASDHNGLKFRIRFKA